MYQHFSLKTAGSHYFLFIPFGWKKINMKKITRTPPPKRNKPKTICVSLDKIWFIRQNVFIHLNTYFITYIYLVFFHESAHYLDFFLLQGKRDDLQVTSWSLLFIYILLRTVKLTGQMWNMFHILYQYI